MRDVRGLRRVFRPDGGLHRRLVLQQRLGQLRVRRPPTGLLPVGGLLYDRPQQGLQLHHQELRVRGLADLVKVIQGETQDAVVAMEHETQAVEAGSASALRTGDVFKEISTIAQRSSELAQTIASSAATQTASTDQVGRSIKDFTGGAVATQKATDSARVTVEDMAKLAESLTASVAQFKLA